jgi:hypothetical protein
MSGRRGIALECDGEELDSKSLSALGVGELNGELTHEGNQIPVRMLLTSACEIYVSGVQIAVETMK